MHRARGCYLKGFRGLARQGAPTFDGNLSDNNIGTLCKWFPGLGIGLPQKCKEDYFLVPQ